MTGFCKKFRLFRCVTHGDIVASTRFTYASLRHLFFDSASWIMLRNATSRSIVTSCNRNKSIIQFNFESNSSVAREPLAAHFAMSSFVTAKHRVYNKNRQKSRRRRTGETRLPVSPPVCAPGLYYRLQNTWGARTDANVKTRTANKKHFLRKHYFTFTLSFGWRCGFRTCIRCDLCNPTSDMLVIKSRQ